MKRVCALVAVLIIPIWVVDSAVDFPITPHPAPRPARAVTLDHCQQELDVGPCDAVEERFGLEIRTGRCEKFVYGGCGGNSNNFETLLECRLACED